VANVYENRLALSDVQEIGATEAEAAATRLEAGDLLIVEGNGSLDQIGRVAMWNGELKNCLHQNHLIRWRATSVNPKFILYWLMSPAGRHALEKVASSTTGLHTLSISKVSSISVQVPARGEQDEIVRRIEALQGSLTTALDCWKRTQELATQLCGAILSKAFSGELRL